MRSNEVFALMSPEEAKLFLDDLRESSRDATAIALSAAAQAFKLRPEFLRKQPRTRQAEWMRKALARASSAAVAEELLAEYFLGGHLDLLTELLDGLGIEHEEGVLREESPGAPDRDALREAVERFRAGDHPERRKLLLRAFAAQTPISWPELEEMVRD
jgi:hypothetical protein